MPDMSGPSEQHALPEQGEGDLSTTEGLPQVAPSAPSVEPAAATTETPYDSLLMPDREQPKAQGLQTEGFAHHMEGRPENLLRTCFRRVIDASHHVREVTTKTIDRLKIVRIKDIFQGRDEVFLGFGTPNVYLVCPDGDGGYQKFAGKSFRLAPSKMEPIDPKKEWVQSGILFRLKNLPEGAVEAIQQGMVKEGINNEKFVTCVKANCYVLDAAGFTLGNGRALRSFTFPRHFIKSLEKHGLRYQGKLIDFDVIRTTKKSLTEHVTGILRAEANVLWRKVIKPKLHKWGVKFSPKQKAPKEETPRIMAPPLDREREYKQDMVASINTVASIAAPLRLVWGAHHLLRLTQDRVNVDSYLDTPLLAFPQENPSRMTKIKRDILFSKPSIWLARKLLCPSFMKVGDCSELSVYDSLFTHAPGQANKYNLVVTKDEDGTQTMTIGKLEVRRKLVDWVMAKHVLVSGYHPDVRFAGEIWKDETGTIWVSGNSGTYRPTDQQAENMTSYLKAVFPSLTIKKAEFDA